MAAHDREADLVDPEERWTLATVRNIYMCIHDFVESFCNTFSFSPVVAFFSTTNHLVGGNSFVSACTFCLTKLLMVRQGAFQAS